MAIKCVRRQRWLASADDSSEAHFYDRFFAAEAALVGRLSHPNVVQIFDAVADPVQPHLVMEYVPGTTLRSFLPPGRVAVARADRRDRLQVRDGTWATCTARA